MKEKKEIKRKKKYKIKVKALIKLIVFVLVILFVIMAFRSHPQVGQIAIMKNLYLIDFIPW